METYPAPQSSARPWYAAIACFTLASLTPAVLAAESPLPAGIEVRRDVPYAANTNPRQTLDLYLAKERAAGAKLPVIVFIHGGGWVGGNKSSGRAALQGFVAGGNYAAASVAYRLAGEARWPAQIHDCKAAIRWIRANAPSLGIDGERIAVMGTSAGGTLATLLGVSSDVAELEGTVGPHAGTSSRVTCVVNRCGRLDFDAEPEAARAGPSQAKALEGRLTTMFGAPFAERRAAARQGSPITHVTADDPPVITLHGTRDELVPISQAEAFDAAAQKAGARHLMIRVVNGGHGFDHPEAKRRERQFLDLHLRGIPATISSEPIVLTPKAPK